MKYFPFFIVFCIALVNYRYANGQIVVGVHGGMNISSINPPIITSDYSVGNYFKESGAMNAYYIGVLSELKISRSNSLQIEVDYSQKEFSKHTTSYIPGFSFLSDEKISVNVIELKALVLYGLPLGNGKVSIGAGSGLGYSISGRNKERYISSYTPDTLRYKDITTEKFIPAASGLLKYELRVGIFFEIMFDYVFNAQPKTNLAVFSLGGGCSLKFIKKKRK